MSHSKNKLSLQKQRRLFAFKIKPLWLGGIYPQSNKAAAPDTTAIDREVSAIDTHLKRRPMPEYDAVRGTKSQISLKPGY